MQQVFVTDNLRLAMALTAAGFAIKQAHNTIGISGNKAVVCELEPEHNGVSANYLKVLFEYMPGRDADQYDLVSIVNKIIEARGITREEYVLLAFDAARAALHNRSSVVYCVNQQQPLVAKELPDGRAIIYRKGIPREELKRLIDNS